MLVGSVSTLAILYACSGIGSVLAGLVAAYRSQPSQRLLLVAAGCFTVLLALVGVSPWPWLTMVLLTALGFCGVTSMTAANTLLQLRVPGDLRGRVMGIYVLVFVGTTPIGSYLSGWLAARLGGGGATGVREMVLVTAGLCGAGVVVGAVYARRSRGGDIRSEDVQGAA